MDDPDLQIEDAPALRRYEARQGGALAGFAEYRLAPGRIIFTHTQVEPDFAGHGVATALVKVALDDARERGLFVTPICPFFAAYIKRHAEYAGLVRTAREMRGDTAST